MLFLIAYEFLNKGMTFFNISEKKKKKKPIHEKNITNIEISKHENIGDPSKSSSYSEFFEVSLNGFLPESKMAEHDS